MLAPRGMQVPTDVASRLAHVVQGERLMGLIAR
jgi:hypothetical protein